MTTMVTHSLLLTRRSVLGLLRQPVFLLITLVQPMIWLLLFGQLFQSVVRIPGFAGTDSFLEFLTPGVVVMTAMFSAVWSGTTFIDDMERGVMDRFLASPVSRAAMMNGTLAYQALASVVQTAVVLVVAFVSGARFAWGGVLVTAVAGVLVTVVFAAFSNAVALLLRQQEALIGIFQFASLPLTFLSSAVMDPSLAPHWIRVAARFNPIDWAVVASRESLLGGTDWALVWPRLAGLAALAVVMAALATRAFRAYQRSL